MSEQKGLSVLKNMVNSDYVKSRFVEVMGDKAPAFLASILNATRTNPALIDCDPQSVISSAMVAATLDLTIDGSLGFAALVPYRNKGVLVAQFQIMTKGFVQLALRSGQYKTINVGPIYLDEFGGYDIITGEVSIHPVDNGFRSKDDDTKIVGYVAFFRLTNGYECTRYWPMGKILAHGKRYSKSFEKECGLWKTDLPAMASKTVLKNTLSKWGILSIAMQKAVEVDQAAISGIGSDQTVDYVDAPDQESVSDRTPEEVVKPAANATPAPKSDAPTSYDLWTKLEEYRLSDQTPKIAKDDIEAAMKSGEERPVELDKLLNRVKDASNAKR